MPGGGTGNAVFILRILTENYCSWVKDLFHKYVDSEKVVNKVPQKVACYAFRKSVGTEYLVQNMLHSGFKIAVSIDSKLSDFFFAWVACHCNGYSI